jgi:hypothetical protein
LEKPETIAAELAFEGIDVEDTQKLFHGIGPGNTPDKIASAVGTLHSRHFSLSFTFLTAKSTFSLPGLPVTQQRHEIRRAGTMRELNGTALSEPELFLQRAFHATIIAEGSCIENTRRPPRPDDKLGSLGLQFIPDTTGL